MQMTCEQCPDVTYTENHQHRLSRKSFTWSWNETTQHSCNKFHSITSSCHSRKIVQVHADHEECCRQCVDDICACRWCADYMQMTYVIHQPNLQPSLTLMSSTCCSHVVHASSARDFSSQTISSQRAETALLIKIKAWTGITSNHIFWLNKIRKLQWFKHLSCLILHISICILCNVSRK